MKGRPSVYSKEAAAKICQRIAEGETLRQICRGEGMPARSTVQKWIVEDIGGFSSQYVRAREAQFEAMADEILDIADGDMDANDKRVRVDSRKWLLSKLKPERYGDSLKLSGELELNHKTDAQLESRLAQLLGKAGTGGAAGGEGTPEETA